MNFLPNRQFRRLAFLAKYLRSWQPGMTFQLSVMCFIRGFFTGCFSRATHKLVANSTDSSFETWFFTDLSHSPLTNKPTYIQGKMIEEITIKFGTKLKPTQYSWKSQLYRLNNKQYLIQTKFNLYVKNIKSIDF